MCVASALIRDKTYFVAEANGEIVACGLTIKLVPMRKQLA